MSIQARTLGLFLAAIAALLVPTGARGGLITQSASIPLTSTDFGPGSAGVQPLVFQKFDTHSDALALDSVTLSYTAQIQNTFGMTFTTPATITDSVATGNAATPGPTITLYQPDGTHALLTVKAPNDPAFLSRSVTYGSATGQTLPQTFSSSLPTTSPFYLAPAVSKLSNSLNLTAPADLAVFTGTGALSLPVVAKAFSQFTTSSGNGSGSVTTQGSAAVTITYNYHSNIPAGETVPEPTTVVLWGIGGSILLAAHRGRRRLA
jgi:hypothetical protein